MNIVAGALAGTGPGAGWRIGPDEAAGNQLIAAYGGNNTSGPREVASALSAHGGTGRHDFETETFVAHTLRGEGFDASEDGTGRGTPLVPVAFDTTQITSAANRSNPRPGDPCHPLAAGAHAPAIAFHGSQDPDVSGDVTHPVGRNQGQETCAMVGAAVRRLMPIECERLQGFPDNWTRITGWNGWRKLDVDETPERCEELGLEVRQNRKTGAWRVKDVDGPRYKALGNSWACNVARWVGMRIQIVDALKEAA